MEHRHAKEKSMIEEKTDKKIEREKSEIKDETKALVEESTDINEHIKRFKEDLMGKQLRNERKNQEDNYRDAQREAL